MASTCTICAKTPEAAHTSQTREKHLAHMARLGWSGMCTAPQSS